MQKFLYIVIFAAVETFKLLDKYRPESKEQKKRRLAARAAERAKGKYFLGIFLKTWRFIKYEELSDFEEATSDFHVLHLQATFIASQLISSH